MTHFEEYGAGRFFGPITDKAAAFADGNADRLASVCFVKFLSERAVEFDWSPEEPTTLTAGGCVIRIVALSEEPETFIPADAPWTFYVLIESGLAAILGATTGTEPTKKLLPPLSWLRLFPNHWLPRAAATLGGGT